MRAYSLFALFAFSATAGWGQHFSTEGRLHGGTPESGKGQGSRTAAAQRHAPSTAVAGLAEAPTLELTPLAAEAAAVVQQTQAGRRVGRVRGLAAGAVGKGAWASLTDGRAVWRLAIRSPEATELRVHFTGFHAGGGRVWIYSDGNGARVQEFSGDGVHGDGDFWTSTVSAERLTIEFAAEDGLQHDAPPFQIAEIGHLWELTTPVLTESAGSKAAELSLAAGAASPRAAASALSLAAAGGEGREIAGCHLDVACFPEFKQPASAVARIIFAASGGFYVCSGSLVNSKSGNGTPLFLTADHCINNEESARSVQANFFYESESCGGGLRQVENVLGANYLVSGALSQGDFSLIRLLGLPQSPVFFLGITTVEPAIGTRLTGIHHPEGSYKRISFGPRTADETVGVGDGGGVTASPASKFYQVDQREGRVEGGSSGSPLLNPNKQLVGMLSSGPVFSAIPAEDEVLMCLATEVITQYGRVSTAWPSLEPFVNDLRPGRMAVPQAGDKFASKKVKFQWSPGVGVTQYRLQLGKTKGGSEYVDVTQRAGETSFTADGLPEDGSPVYARLGSLVDGAWSTLEYTYLASSGGTARPAQIVSPSVNG